MEPVDDAPVGRVAARHVRERERVASVAHDVVHGVEVVGEPVERRQVARRDVVERDRVVEEVLDLLARDLSARRNDNPSYRPRVCVKIAATPRETRRWKPSAPRMCHATDATRDPAVETISAASGARDNDGSSRREAVAATTMATMTTMMTMMTMTTRGDDGASRREAVAARSDAVGATDDAHRHCCDDDDDDESTTHRRRRAPRRRPTTTHCVARRWNARDDRPTRPAESDGSPDESRGRDRRATADDRAGDGRLARGLSRGLVFPAARFPAAAPLPPPALLPPSP